MADQGGNGEAGRVHLYALRGERRGTEVGVLKRGTGEEERHWMIENGRRKTRRRECEQRQASGQENQEIEEKLDVPRASERGLAGTKTEAANLSVPGW